MKYKVYLTDSIEGLRNEEYVGTFDTEDEAAKEGLAAYKAKGYHREPYTRGLLYPCMTIYDAGSYCHFIAVIKVED